MTRDHDDAVRYTDDLHSTREPAIADARHPIAPDLDDCTVVVTSGRFQHKRSSLADGTVLVPRAVRHLEWNTARVLDRRGVTGPVEFNWIKGDQYVPYLYVASPQAVLAIDRRGASLPTILAALGRSEDDEDEEE